MKKRVLFAAMIIFLLGSMSFVSIDARAGQTVNTELSFVPALQQDIPVPADVPEVLSNVDYWVGSFIPLVGLTIFLTAFLLKFFAVTGSGLKQIFSWGVGFVLVIIFNLLHLGIAYALSWYGVLAYGLAISLAANRLFDVGLLNAILTALKLTK